MEAKTEERNTEIKRIQEAETEILKVFLDLVNEHNLRYFALGGTLLGAVRHQGFIPWDDDIDIGMPRPDYERFLEIAEKQLDDPYYLRTFKNGKRYSSLYFSQIANRNVSLKRISMGNLIDDHAWIDVFPLDGVPEGKIEFHIWKNKAMLFSKLFTLSQMQKNFSTKGKSIGEYRTKKEKFIFIFLKLHGQNLLNSNYLWNALDRELKKYKYSSSDRLINFCGNWRMKEMFEKNVYGKGMLFQFEGFKLNGPENYDFVLSQMYGDYMVLPPEEKRNHHDIYME